MLCQVVEIVDGAWCGAGVKCVYMYIYVSKYLAAEYLVFIVIIKKDR